MNNEININDLTLGQIKEIQSLDLGFSSVKTVLAEFDPITTDKGRCIVIGNRGNIVVGDLTVTNGTGTLKNASVIRVWGTTQGLGQLALKGKTEKTILDYCGEFEVEMLTICGTIPVKSDL